MSVHLPVKVYRDGQGSWKCERTKHVSTEALFACRSKFGSRLLFVGSCHAEGASIQDKLAIEKMLLEHDCIPVFQDSIPAFDKFSLFCQSFLWPVMNNQLPLQEDTEILLWDDDLWKAYKAVNESFCVRTMAVINELYPTKPPSTFITVWTNDFHLFLLPALLRKRLSSPKPTSVDPPSSGGNTPPMMPHVALGMFVHSPFPTSEIFLTLPVRSEIMRGLLSVDLLGFQFYDYARHFFSGAQKLFGVRATAQKGGLLALEVSEERSVYIHITHNCIEHEYVIEEVSSRQVQRRAAALRDRFNNRVIIGSVVRLGRTSGILLKLGAFKAFLQQYEQYQRKVVLVVYLIRRGSQTTTPEHTAIAEGAMALADEINQELGFHVEVKDSVEEFDRCSLLCVTDVLLESSLKDGLNLVPFEYLAARDAWLKLEGAMVDLSTIHAHADVPLSHLPADEMDASSEEDSFTQALVSNCRSTGRIVISEFTGSSQVLPGALRVNPWHADTILAALDESLTMPLHLAHAAFTRDANYVSSQSQVNWAKEFTVHVIRAAMASEPSAAGESQGSPRSSVLPAAYSAIPRLNREPVLAAFRQARSRVIFLDNEGTLAPNLSRIYRHYGSVPLANPLAVDLQSKGSGPSEEVIRILCTLCSDPRNIVMILSGRGKAALTHWFGPVLPKGLGLAAEHGFFWMHPRLTHGWRCLIADEPEAAAAWIPLTEEIMNRYVNRTPNTYIEDKGSARVWQFRDAEAEFGACQAKELHGELELALRTDAVDITTGKGYVEVKLRGVNKGAAVQNVLAALRNDLHVSPEFVLCIGDDRSDESMFEQLLTPIPNTAIFTSTVGRKKSMAKFFLSDVDHVTALLGVLAEA